MGSPGGIEAIHVDQVVVLPVQSSIGRLIPAGANFRIHQEQKWQDFKTNWMPYTKCRTMREGKLTRLNKMDPKISLVPRLRSENTLQ